MSPQVTLNKLASKEVGRAGSTYIFVTVNTHVRVVYTRKNDLDKAIEFAKTLGEKNSVLVENCDGIVWENGLANKLSNPEDTQS